MADVADILAGAFGGFANPNDPFSYAKIQLGRQDAAENQRRGDLLAGELALRQQMQPYSIADLQAGIKEKGAEADRAEAAAESARSETKRLEDTYKSGQGMRDFTSSLYDRLNKALAGGDTAAAAPADAAKAALDAMNPDLYAGQPTFDENGPAALLGLPMPTGNPIADMMTKFARQNAVTKLFGQNADTGTAAAPGISITPGMTASDLMGQAAAVSAAKDQKAAAVKAAADYAQRTTADALQRKSSTDIITKMLSSDTVAKTPELQAQIQDLIQQHFKRFPTVAPTLENIGQLPLEDLLGLRDDISFRIKRQMGL